MEPFYRYYVSQTEAFEFKIAQVQSRSTAMSYQSPFLNSLGDDPRLNTQFPGVGVPPNNARVDPIVESWTDPSRQSAEVQTQGRCVACGSINLNPAHPDYCLDVSSHVLAEHDDESEEGSDIEAVAPGLALKATTTNLAAVLRLNSAMIYFSELVKTYISFDEICRDGKQIINTASLEAWLTWYCVEMTGWKAQAAKHFDQLQTAINQIFQAYHRTLLRNRDNESVLLNTARRIIDTGKACKRTYLDEKAQGMLLVVFVQTALSMKSARTFLYAIAKKLEDWERDGKKEIDMLRDALASKWKQDSER